MKRTTINSAALLALLLGVLLGGTEMASAQTPGGLRDVSKDSLSLSAPTYRLEAWRAGVYLGLNLNHYVADNMEGMPGVPNCCPGFDEGNGIGIASGMMVETPINDWFSVGGRLYMSTYNGALVEEEDEVVDDGSGLAANGVFEHRIDADIWAVAVEPIVVFGVVDEVKLFTGVRGDVIVRKLFAQKEEILEPSDILYENGKRTRLEYDGAVPNGTSFQAAIVAGVRYDFFVDENREWAISPELSAWYSPSPVIRDESWKIHGVRLAFIGQYLSYQQEEYPMGPVPPPVGLEKMDTPDETPTGSGLSDASFDVAPVAPETPVAPPIDEGK